MTADATSRSTRVSMKHGPPTFNGIEWLSTPLDYGFRSRLSSAAPRIASQNLPLFSRSELKTMIDTAHALRTKVAAHAVLDSTIRTLVELGVDSIEHGHLMEDGALYALRNSKGKTTWNPTLATFSRFGPYSEIWKDAKRTFQRALEIGGIKIACGGDTGSSNSRSQCSCWPLMITNL